MGDLAARGLADLIALLAIVGLVMVGESASDLYHQSTLEAAPTVPVDEVLWELTAEQPLAPPDGSSGVLEATPVVESHGRIDYLITTAVPGGGSSQVSLSELYVELTGERYVGSQVVTIFEDATADGSDARLEIHECVPPEGETLQCATPDGRAMGAARYRVDIHLPAGSSTEHPGS